MNVLLMEKTMRWFGPGDNFSLENIRQAGCTGVVTALHHIPYGDTWSVHEIETRKKMIEKAGLTWSVIESLPVHEDIKKQSGQWRKYLDNYKMSLRNIASCGLKVVTYNFMPVFDWLRTDMTFQLPDGSESLRFEKNAFVAFDLFLLKRPRAENDYGQNEIEQARQWLNTHTAEEIEKLRKNLLFPLPGSDELLTEQRVLNELKEYEFIDREMMKKHLFDFLRAVIPIAEELGLKLAIHPDDPPFSVFGLPRVVCTSEDIQDILEAVPSSANGLCFCSGSYGAREDNVLESMIDRFGDAIQFLHLRNTKRDAQGNFHESGHLSGDADMASIVKSILKLMNRRGESIPMRPDHGHCILDDLNKEFYPGYSGIGRMKGLAELRGLELAIGKQLPIKEKS